MIFVILKEHTDIEWKFSRTKLFMEYIKDASVLPIPFNIIPTPALVFDSLRRLIKRGDKKKLAAKKALDKNKTQHKNPNSMSNYSEARRKYEDELTFKVNLKI